MIHKQDKEALHMKKSMRNAHASLDFKQQLPLKYHTSIAVTSCCHGEYALLQVSQQACSNLAFRLKMTCASA